MESGLREFDIDGGGLFAPGDIYWEKPDGGEICVLKYGRPIHREFLKKFRTLKFRDNIDRTLVEELRGLLQELKRAVFMPDKIKARKKLLAFVSDHYRSKGKASNVLDFMVAFGDEFYSLPTFVEDEFLKYSDDLFKRGHILGP